MAAARSSSRIASAWESHPLNHTKTSKALIQCYFRTRENRAVQRASASSEPVMFPHWFSDLPHAGKALWENDEIAFPKRDALAFRLDGYPAFEQVTGFLFVIVPVKR